MRRSERSLQHQRLARVKPPDGAPDARCLQALFGSQFRQDRAHSRGQQRLAGARRSDHQQMVGAGRGDGHSAFRGFLPFDVAVIDGVFPEFRNRHRPVERIRRNLQLAAEEADGIGQGRNRDHLDPFHNGRFPSIRGRDDDSFQP